jgi:hypothetical protein
MINRRRTTRESHDHLDCRQLWHGKGAVAIVLKLEEEIRT